MQTILQLLRKELKAIGNKTIQEKTQYYFKDEVACYGIKSAEVHLISKFFYKQLGECEKSKIFEYCETLWQSGMIEECMIACNWADAQHRKFEQVDFELFEKWVHSYISNWATCDTFCNHTVGNFIMKYPEYITQLKCWAKSENRWVRRAASVSLIVPAKKGKFISDIFEISDILLTDADDMVQKGYGWMLKSASQAHRDEVFNYVMNNKDRMPRTALRYAIEKMPTEMRLEAMAK